MMIVVLSDASLCARDRAGADDVSRRGAAPIDPAKT
jgi:hypothetical protein